MFDLSDPQARFQYRLELLDQMSFRNHRMGGQQLLGITNCPHCGVAHPFLTRVWASEQHVIRATSGASSRWAAFACTSCGSIVTAKGNPNETVSNPLVQDIFPPIWEAHPSLPERVASYLSQARATLANPDASVVMSASTIDAMLKHHKLTDGSLYKRIEEAVQAGVLTSTMAEWAHRVRLDANNPRHADDATPNLSVEDAHRAFEFADALSTYLFVLPSKMPPKPV